MPWATLSRKFLLCTGLGEPCSIFASVLLVAGRTRPGDGKLSFKLEISPFRNQGGRGADTAISVELSSTQTRTRCSRGAPALAASPNFAACLRVFSLDPAAEQNQEAASARQTLGKLQPSTSLKNLSSLYCCDRQKFGPLCLSRPCQSQKDTEPAATTKHGHVPDLLARR